MSPTGSALDATSATSAVKHRVFLIGYMCSGKTTLGRALSCRLEMPFVDLDEYIEASRGRTIGEIFATDGEPTFRDIERRALSEVIDRYPAAIIACGGGTPCFGNNLEIMRRAGTTVWLDADRRRLIDRLVEGADRRPLVRGKSRQELEAYVDRALADREPFYCRADLRFDATYLEDQRQIDSSVDSFISLLQTLADNVRQ